MHKQFIVLFLLSFLSIMSSCEKSETSPSIESLIVGKWELKTSHNGQGGSVEYLSGNGKILEFTKKTFKSYESGNLIDQGQYIIVQAHSLLTGEKLNRILFNTTADKADDHIRLGVEVNNNELVMSIDAYDGSSSKYQKIN